MQKAFLLPIGIFLVIFLLYFYQRSLYQKSGYRISSIEPAKYFLSDQSETKVNDNIVVNDDRNRTIDTIKDVRMKYILTWCDAWGSKMYGFDFGPEKFVEAGCSVSKCFVTSNRSLLISVADFDAIMFHQRSFSWKDAPNPEERRPSQRYIHWMMESPAHLKYDKVTLSGLSTYFNWSMSYRTN